MIVLRLVFVYFGMFMTETLQSVRMFKKRQQYLLVFYKIKSQSDTLIKTSTKYYVDMFKFVLMKYLIIK